MFSETTPAAPPPTVLEGMDGVESSIPVLMLKHQRRVDFATQWALLQCWFVPVALIVLKELPGYALVCSCLLMIRHRLWPITVTMEMPEMIISGNSHDQLILKVVIAGIGRLLFIFIDPSKQPRPQNTWPMAGRTCTLIYFKVAIGPAEIYVSCYFTRVF